MKPMFADLKAERACSLETVKSNPKTLTSPFEGFSSPAIRLRTVVLPAPDGPTIAATSPSLTSRVIDARALTAFPFRRYSLDTLTRSTANPGALTSMSSSSESIGVHQELNLWGRSSLYMPTEGFGWMAKGAPTRLAREVLRSVLAE